MYVSHVTLLIFIKRYNDDNILVEELFNSITDSPSKFLLSSSLLSLTRLSRVEYLTLSNSRVNRQTPQTTEFSRNIRIKFEISKIIGITPRIPLEKIEMFLSQFRLKKAQQQQHIKIPFDLFFGNNLIKSGVHDIF